MAGDEYRALVRYSFSAKGDASLVHVFLAAAFHTQTVARAL
jgi:hypothetical protein